MRHDQKVIFHLDMDAFFASIEQRDNPSYRGKPVIVGAKPGGRGVVSAASYEARKFGVHSALPISIAFQRCPQGIYVTPSMNKYITVSKQLMSILNSFTPLIEPLSVDEAFMDMSGTQKLFGPPRKAAELLRMKIKEELQLTGSCGIAPNKFLAKLASDINKPDGITEVPFDKEEIIKWLAPMKVSRIWGVGKKTEEQLSSAGIFIIEDLQKLSLSQLENMFKDKGSKALYNLSRGIDFRDVHPPEEVKSVSREHTFKSDSTNINEWKSTLLFLSREVAQRTRKKNLKGKTVTLTYRTPDFKRYSRQAGLTESTDLAKVIYEKAITLLEKEIRHLSGLRLIGVGISGFNEEIQQTLFPENEDIKQWEASEKAMDDISKRFGNNTIFRGGELT